MSTVATGSPVAELASCVSGLVGADLDDRHSSDIGEDLVGIRRQIDRLEAEFIRRLSIFERRRGFAADGAASMVAWLRSRCGLAAGGAAGRAEVAHELPSLPEANRLFRDGLIGLDHARVLARTVTEVGPGAAATVGDELVERARSQDPTQLREVSRRMRFVVDPEGATSAYRRMHERRYVNLSQTFDGVFSLDGVLDPEGGATLKTAIDALCAPVVADARTPGQRRADAIVELAHRQLGAKTLPSSGGQRPHLQLTMPAGALHADRGATPAELAGAGPIPAAVAQRIACDSALTPAIDAASGSSEAVGRTTRTIPAAVRRAVISRDRHCVFPSCDRPPEWADVHHIRHHAAGGEARVDNLVLLCRYHHTFVHERGWVVGRGADARFTVRPP